MSRKGIKDKCRIENIDLDKLQKLIDSKHTYRYVEFCSLLGLEKLQGNSKIKQLSELNAICEYEKEGTKFRFIRIRSQNEIVLYDARSKYIPFIECILIDMLLDKIEKGECHNGIYYITTPQSLLRLGMVNENFLLFHSNEQKWEYRRAVAKYHHEDFTVKEINDFMSTTYRHILKPIVRDSYKSLDNKRGLMIQRGYKLFLQGEDKSRTYRNVLSSSREGQVLTNISGKVLEQLGISSMDKLYTHSADIINQFYATCDELCKQELGYDGFYDCYALSINQERLEKIYNWNLCSAQQVLNNKMVERIGEAKQLNRLTGQSRKNLINAVINLETDYDFQGDYNRFVAEKNKNNKEGF